MVLAHLIVLTAMASLPTPAIFPAPPSVDCNVHFTDDPHETSETTVVREKLGRLHAARRNLAAAAFYLVDVMPHHQTMVDPVLDALDRAIAATESELARVGRDRRIVEETFALMNRNVALKTAIFSACDKERVAKPTTEFANVGINWGATVRFSADRPLTVYRVASTKTQAEFFALTELLGKLQ